MTTLHFKGENCCHFSGRLDRTHCWKIWSLMLRGVLDDIIKAIGFEFFRGALKILCCFKGGPVGVKQSLWSIRRDTFRGESNGSLCSKSQRLGWDQNFQSYHENFTALKQGWTNSKYLALMLFLSLSFWLQISNSQYSTWRQSINYSNNQV